MRKWYRRKTVAERRAWIARRNDELVRAADRRRGFRGTTTTPEKQQARQAVANALRSGKLTRPSVCDACGQPGRRIEAHHDDYGTPFDVDWLCTVCHGKRHRTVRA